MRLTVVALTLGLAVPIHAQQKRIDWPSVIALTASTYADTKSTTHVLPLGYCHESNTFLGPHPTDSSLYFNMAAEVGSLVILNMIAERSSSKRLKAISHVLNYSLSGIHGWAAVTNLKNCS